MEAFQGLEVPLHYRGSRLLGLSSFISALFTGVGGRVFLRSWTSALRRSTKFATTSNPLATAKIAHTGDALMPLPS